MMKTGKVDKQGESMVASYRYLGVSNPGLQMIWSNECDVSCLYSTRASFQYIRRIPALYYSQAKKPLGSWNLVNPLLRMNECIARLQPLVNQYKPKQHQTFAIEKFRNAIVTTRSCPGDKNISLKNFCLHRWIYNLLFA